MKATRRKKHDEEEKHLISRKEAVEKLGSFALISATTLMVLMPSKTHAEGSPSPSSDPPKVPKRHGL